MALGRILGGIHDPQDEVDHHGDQQQDGQRRGPEPVVEAGLATHPDRLRSPMIGPKCIYERGDRDAGEAEGGDLGGLVAKVEHADGEGADNDGEVQPREEGPLVGEVDFGLDAGGEGNALAYKKVVSAGFMISCSHGRVVKYLAQSGGGAGST